MHACFAPTATPTLELAAPSSRTCAGVPACGHPWPRNPVHRARDESHTQKNNPVTQTQPPKQRNDVRLNPDPKINQAKQTTTLNANTVHPFTQQENTPKTTITPSRNAHQTPHRLRSQIEDSSTRVHHNATIPCGNTGLRRGRRPAMAVSRFSLSKLHLTSNRAPAENARHQDIRPRTAVCRMTNALHQDAVPRHPHSRRSRSLYDEGVKPFRRRPSPPFFGDLTNARVFPQTTTQLKTQRL